MPPKDKNYWTKRRKRLELERKCKRCGRVLDEDADNGRMYCWICSDSRRDDIESLMIIGGTYD